MPTVSRACCLCINTWYSSLCSTVQCTQQAASLDASLHALHWQCTSEGSTSSFKSITWNELWLEINFKIWDGRCVGNMSVNVYAKFRCAVLHIKKAIGIFRELIPRRTTRVAFWDPPSRSKNNTATIYCNRQMNTFCFTHNVNAIKDTSG